MASSYPSSLDSFTDPTSGSSLASPSHSGQHIDLNDAVEKLEAKLGIGSSAASAASEGAVLKADGSGATTYAKNGLWFIAKYTFTSTGTWQATNVFTSTFENYRIIVNCTSASGTAAQIQVRLLVGTTPTTTNYYNYYRGITWAGSNDVTAGNNVGNWFAMRSNASPWSGVMDIHHPQLAQKTVYSSQGSDSSQQWQSGGYQDSSTQFDGIEFASSGAFAMTGTIRVYGYQN